MIEGTMIFQFDTHDNWLVIMIDWSIDNCSENIVLLKCSSDGVVTWPLLKSLIVELDEDKDKYIQMLSA